MLVISIRGITLLLIFQQNSNKSEIKYLLASHALNSSGLSEPALLELRPFIEVASKYRKVFVRPKALSSLVMWP